MKSKLKIDYATHKAAKFACEHYHYSKTIPVNKLLKYSVYEDDTFKGVIIYGMGTSAQISKRYNLENYEMVELVRVALKSHDNEVSKMIAITLKMIKKDAPKIKLIVSFADNNEGHHGGIYQATNWIYTGESSKTKEYYYNNKWRHATDVYKRLKPEEIKNLPQREKTGKHRYLFPLDKEVKKEVEKLAKQYPKRAVIVESDISEYHSEEAGAVPSTALLSENNNE